VKLATLYPAQPPPEPDAPAVAPRAVCHIPGCRWSKTFASVDAREIELTRALVNLIIRCQKALARLETRTGVTITVKGIPNEEQVTPSAGQPEPKRRRKG
jgi:hypothetical protein